MTEQSEMRFKTGDEITIMRGKLKGQTAIVLEADKAERTYAAKLAGGGLAVVNEVNVKVPDEATITAQDLADALGTEVQFTQDTIDRLENRAPGITAHLVLAKVSVS
jgi:ribosomal protein L24